MSILDDFVAFLARLFGPAPSPTPVPKDEPLQTISPRVFIINFDPIVDAQGNRLSAKMGWSNVDDLIPNFIAEIDEVSYGLVKYQYDSANRIDVNEFPRKVDGFQYTANTYLAMMANEATHHNPDNVDYWNIVNTYHLIDRVMNHEIDEVWLFGGPYFGFWESHMVGRGAIWCNSSPLANSDQCTRRFVIMGFNYQRGVAEMIHDIGHRLEATIANVYGSLDTLGNAYNAVNPNVQPPIGPDKFMHPQNDFERFLLFEKIAPGRAEMGLIHTPPNASRDTDWQNMTMASSGCDAWLNYPALQGDRRAINSTEWGGSADGHAYYKWWFKHVPHAAGSLNSISNNWWRYVMQVDKPLGPG